MDTLGGTERRLTSNAWSSQVPSWFPDGRETASFANPNGREQLFVMTLASREVRPLITGLGTNGQPSWSLDGLRLLFTIGEGGKSDVQVVGRDGSGLTRLTRGLEGVR